MAPPSRSQPQQVPDSPSFDSNDTNLLTISGTTATIKGAGAVTITATQAGNDSYNPASKSRLFNLLKKDQTITFAAIADTNTTIASITPGATASSGLTVSYESNDTSIVTASGSTLNINGGGFVSGYNCKATWKSGMERSHFRSPLLLCKTGGQANDAHL